MMANTDCEAFWQQDTTKDLKLMRENFQKEIIKCVFTHPHTLHSCGALHGSA